MAPDHLVRESQTWDIAADRKIFVLLEMQTYGMGNKLTYYHPTVPILTGQWPQASLVDLWGQTYKSKVCNTSSKKQKQKKKHYGIMAVLPWWIQCTNTS